MREVPPLAERWLEYLEHNRGRSLGTLQKYRGYMAWFVTYLDGREFSSVTLRQLEEFVGIYLHKKGCSPATRNVMISVIRGFYKWAKRVNEIVPNPAEGLDQLKLGYKLPPLMGLDNAQAILNAPDISTFRGLRDCAMFHVLLGTGCRISGLTNLNESGLIWYREENGRERLAIKLTEKGKQDRIVPCPMEVGLMVRAYLGHEHLDSVDRTVGIGDKVVFVNIIGNVPKCNHFGENLRLRPMSVQRIMKGYCEKLDIPREFWHPHAFRHLYATELREGGADLQEIASLLGHKGLKNTEIYTHLAFRRMANLVDKANPMNLIVTPISELAKKMGLPLSQ